MFLRLITLSLLIAVVNPDLGRAGAKPKFSGMIQDAATVCMIGGGIHERSDVTVDYDGKTYHFCCAGCASRFKKNPDSIRRAIDPVNGMQVDKADARFFAVDGRVFFFSSDESRSQFAKHPAKFSPDVVAPECTGDSCRERQSCGSSDHTCQ